MPSRADVFDDVAHGVDAGAVPLDPRQVALRGPTAVAVHDDRDMPGQPLEVDLAGQRLLWRSRRHNGKNVLERHGSGRKLNLDDTGSYGCQQGEAPINFAL